MSDVPRNLTLERINRLNTALADFMDSQNAFGRDVMRILERLDKRMEGIEASMRDMAQEMRTMASEQILLGNRVENAFSRALRTNIRLDEMEDRTTREDKP